MSAIMKKIAFLFLLTFCSVVSAKTYYVSPEGSDNSGNGSKENPWFTLNRAWILVSAGDTILMRGGNYSYMKQSLIGKNGTSGNMIKIWAYPGETPVLIKSGSYADTNWPRAIIGISGNYIHVKGLEICNNSQENNEAYYGLVNLNGNNNLYELLNIHHNGGTGISIEYNSNTNLILNCDIHHNSDPLSIDKNGGADGIGLSHIPAGFINTIRGCRCWWNSDDGIDSYGCDSKLIIDSCWIWYNGYVPDTFDQGGDGTGFKLGKTLSDWGNTVMLTVSNCIAYKNRTLGFHQNEAYAAIALYNNTAYQNGAQGFWFGSFNKPHVLKNNISYQNSSYCYLTSSSIVANNTFLINNTPNPAFSVNDADFNSLDETQLDRPRKAGGSLPYIDFLYPSPGTDLINAGADVGLPFCGDAPEIGAFEMDEGAIHLNQPPVVNIYSPTKGILYTSPATITIDVDATDRDGTISKVELFNSTIKLGERTAAPFSFTLKDLTDGSYSLVAVATDNLKSATSSSVFDLQVKSYNENREYFNLYPNPNNGCFTIDFSTYLEADNFTITVVNLIGKTVHRENFPKEENSRQFDLSHLNPGVYVLMISNDQILLTQKFIKG